MRMKIRADSLENKSDNQNNKRVASKIEVTDWQLTVMVPAHSTLYTFQSSRDQSSMNALRRVV